MKVSREQAAQNRERILDAAGRLFRERGLDGIGVADLMKAAGLTHGGFYGHFKSKEDLMVEVCARALSEGIDIWTRTASAAKERPLTAIGGRYLSPRHRDDPGKGCLIAALGTDIARQGAKVRHVATAGIRNMVDLLAQPSSQRSGTVTRKQAIAKLASWVGAVMLARAVDEPKFSNEILQSVRSDLGHDDKSQPPERPKSTMTA